MIETKPIDGEVLRYQEHRGLNDVPRYGTGLQVRLADGQRVYLALSAAELAVYFEDDVALHYDGQGRLLKACNLNDYWRRSLSNQGLYTRKRDRHEGGGIDRAVMTAAELDELVRDAQEQVAPVCEQLQTGAASIEWAQPLPGEAIQRILPLLQRAARFDVGAAHAEAVRFRDVYGHVAVLPPGEYNSLVLQATEGCAYNGCLFCDLYDGLKYRPKTIAKFGEHIRNAVAFHGSGLQSRRSIFLGEANALALPQPTLAAMLRLVYEHFELPPPQPKPAPADWWLGSETRFDGIASFLDVFTGKPRSETDYAQLRQLGLRRVYIGMETGDNALLEWLRKPATDAAVVDCVRNLKAAGIAVGVMILIGAGGHRFAAAHESATVRVLNELPLGRGDSVYFSPLLVKPAGPYATRAAADGIEPLSRDELKQQETKLRAGLAFSPDRGRPYVARYQLETFVY